MPVPELIRKHFDDSIAIKQTAREVLAQPISDAAQRLAHTLAEGGKILVCGNGGSAADAQHFAAELVGRFERERPALPAIALTTDTSALTAIGNDYGFDRVFARQVDALAQRGDCLVALSTSGRSPNVLLAVEAAQARGAWVLALTGRDGGPIATTLTDADIELRVPSEVTARIQEVHILALHCLCSAVDQLLFPQGA